ncbi:hypothetical protein EGW08_018423 [Elysia chlorotica]|uniref:BZIP domain-containing protein n=1 Tax=Elysia chlorotica TaxID=188477 RepID=A0A433SWX3_ELYCH|nr:hypothetical protein EGW08_018423 [Elysia chlorotica]
MTMDYHNPYMYPGYYYPPHQGSGFSFPARQHSANLQQQQQQQPQQQPPAHSNVYSNRNFPSSSCASISQRLPYHHLSQHPYLNHHQQQQQQQQQQHPISSPYPLFQDPQHNRHSQQQQQQHQHFRKLPHQRHSSFSTSQYLPNFLVSPGTGLTPTTIASIEQSLLELNNQQQQQQQQQSSTSSSSQNGGGSGGGGNGGSAHTQSHQGGSSLAGRRDPLVTTQSGFVPPVVDPGHSAEVSQDSMDQDLDCSSDYSDDWEPKKKRGRLSGGAGGSSNPDLIVTADGTINAAPQRKYTRRNKDEKLPPEEEERRRVRRERNKLAAAKCRQRRVDHTNELVEETEELEREQSELEQEIASLQQEKDQLEFILQAHQPVCKVAQRQVALAAAATQVKVKVERPSLSPPPLPHRNGLAQNLSMTSSSSLANSTTVTTTAVSSSHLMPDQQHYQPSPPSFSAPSPQAVAGGHLESLAATSRPNSLPLIKRNRARMLQASVDAANATTNSASTPGTMTINTPTSGLSITPSSLFCPGLDSMVDGSTGLTPITGLSCSSQVTGLTGRSNVSTTEASNGGSGNDAVGSPTLISL